MTMKMRGSMSEDRKSRCVAGITGGGPLYLSLDVRGQDGGLMWETGAQDQTSRNPPVSEPSVHLSGADAPRTSLTVRAAGHGVHISRCR